MRVKLRPGTHFAPVPQGVYFSGAGPAFVLTAPPILYPVLDSQVGLLADGTDLDELVVALGNESARPVLDRVLRALVDRDFLLDLDSLGTAAPDPVTTARYAEVLSYLEAHCAEPYKAFAQLRASRVGVLGGGPALPVLLRALTRYGVDALALSDLDSAVRLEATVVIDDLDAPLDLLALSRSHPRQPLLPVTARYGLALVGPVLTGPAELTDFLAVAQRAGEWTLAEPGLAAPRPLSAVLAGSLAGHQVLSALVAEDPGTGRDSSPSSTAGAATGPAAPTTVLVHGPQLSTRSLLLGPLQPPAASAASAATTTGDLAGEVDGDWPDAPAATADQTLTSWAALTNRWTGVLRRGRDLDLVQMPLSLATVEVLPVGPSDRVAGWGSDRARAGLNAVLTGVRSWAGRQPGRDRPGGRAAAGYSYRRWLLDGLLRGLGPEVLSTAQPMTEIGWADLTRPGHRTLWSLCAEYFDRPVTLHQYGLAGTGLTLVQARDAAGEIRVAEWGYSLDNAIQHALSSAVAHAQAPADVRGWLSGTPVGTQLLETATPGQLDPVVEQLRALLRREGRRVDAERITSDPVLGTLAVYCGPVWLS